MTDSEIYKLWLSRVSDNRHLRYKRWVEIRKVIEENNIKSVLEFGSGVSTLLFSNLGLRLFSLETDLKYMSFVRDLCANKVHFIYWDGTTVPMKAPFDLCLVDGALPRLPQLLHALKKSSFIAVDDYVGAQKRQFEPHLANLERIDSGETILAVFKNV